MSIINLDNNATTPIDPEVRKKIVNALDVWVNPSSSSPYADVAGEAISGARSNVAFMLNVPYDSVIFTSGGTEVNNWVIASCVEGYVGDGLPHVVTSNIEHPSITVPLLKRKEKGQIDVTFVAVDPSTGAVRVEDVVAAVRASTVLVTVMLANNETGVIQPLAEISRGVKSKSSALVHTDAAQAIGKIPINVPDLGVDAMTIVGHKFYGPRIGALALRSRDVKIRPMFFGGNQEFGLRSGTENTPMIVGLGAAADLVSYNVKEYEKKMKEIRDYFEDQLKIRFGDSHKVHFQSSNRLPNTSSVAFLGYDSHACELLNKCREFSASTGAACHKNECSPILKACGISFEVASKTLRISFGRSNTKEEVDIVVDELFSLCGAKKDK